MKTLLSILACIVLSVLLLPAFLQPPAHDDAQGKSVLLQGATLLEAIEAYREEFGANPAGPAAAILQELRGGNAKGRVFFECPPESVNEKGELLDPWGTPYGITFEPGTQTPMIHSAGKNRLFEADDAKHADDYRSWHANH